MRRYAVMIELGERNHSAWVPDLLGCVSTGRGLPEMRRMIREAIEGHLEVMRDYGDPFSPPSTTCASVDAGRRYAVLVERTDRGFTARAPDVEGCLAGGRTRKEALRILGDALPRHFENLRWSGKPVPEPSCRCEMIEVRMPGACRGTRAAPRTGGRDEPTDSRGRARRTPRRRRGRLPIPA